jgi:hypothetical protein
VTHRIARIADRYPVRGSARLESSAADGIELARKNAQDE